MKRMFMNAVRLVVILPCIVAAQTSSNMEFFGNVNDHPENGYAACWGYTSADGREYALLACYDGTAIIDITGPTPIEVDFIPGPTSLWREMKTYLNYAYIVTENTSQSQGGVQIVDLSYLPDSAMFVKNYVWIDTINATIIYQPAVHSISVNGNYLYLNGGGNSLSGIRILDISDPINPQKIGRLADPYIHDSFVRNDTIYAAAIYGEGITIVDATDKTSPVIVKQQSYFGAGTHNMWTTSDGRYLLTTDEIGDTPKTLKVWDIQNLNSIAKIGDYTNTTATIHNVFIKGNLAYVAWYTAGLQVVDISNPAQPTVVGFYDTYPASNASGYQGAWGADPYFHSGKVIISDRQTGLYVVRYNGDKRGIVKGLVYDYRSLVGIPNVRLNFPELSITRWTDSDGSYIFGYAPGTYRVRIERPGFGFIDTSITVLEGQTTDVDFAPDVLTSAEQSGPSLPSEFLLGQNYPNPFNPSTIIPYEVVSRSHVRIGIYNLLGKEIAVLVDGVKDPGRYSFSLHAGNLPSGVYFYRMIAGGMVQTRRMMVVR